MLQVLVTQINLDEHAVPLALCQKFNSIENFVSLFHESYHILLIGPDGNTAKDLLSLLDS